MPISIPLTIFSIASEGELGLCNPHVDRTAAYSKCCTLRCRKQTEILTPITISLRGVITSLGCELSSHTQTDEKNLRRQGGLWLREKREEAGLSQRELADKIGLKFYSFVSQIENGRTRIPPELLFSWSKALNIKTPEFSKKMLYFFDNTLYTALFGDEKVME